MIVGERKPFDEIKEMMKKFQEGLECGVWRVYIHLHGWRSKGGRTPE